MGGDFELNELRMTKAPANTKGGRRMHLRLAGLAALSAVLVWAAYPPLDFGFLAWAALAPLLVVAARATWRQAAGWSFAAGMGLFIALLHWVRFVTWAGWLALAFYCALYWPAAVLLVRCSRRSRLPMTLAAPLAITALEFLRAHLMSGFPFYFLSHTQHAYTPLIQIADLTGAYGISFLVAAANGAIVDVILADAQTKRRLLWAPGIAALAVLLAVGYGVVRIRTADLREGPKVLLVQGNVPLDLKHSQSLEENLEILERYVDMSIEATAPNVDLIIWPETMFPVAMEYVLDADLADRLVTDKDEEVRGFGRFLIRCELQMTRLIEASDAALLLGAESRANGRYNSAFYFGPKGKLLGRYDKMHLVVFGEYVPLGRLLPFLKRFRPAVMGADLKPGTPRMPFKLSAKGGEEYAFGASICYEDTETGLFRRAAGLGADFMVNVTNDGWFRDSSELDHHLAICAFRAVENRVPIARCANTGISALVDPDGRIRKRIADADGAFREVHGILSDRLMLTGQTSLYTRYGDVFAWLCVFAILGIGLAAMQQRSQKKDATARPTSRTQR